MNALWSDLAFRVVRALTINLLVATAVVTALAWVAR